MASRPAPSAEAPPGASPGFYARHRYAILFYSLLSTLAAAPVLQAFGLGAGFLEIFLALNLVAAVAPIGARLGQKFVLGTLAILLALRIGTLLLDRAGPSAAGYMLWGLVALAAAAGALRFALRAATVDTEHLYAALGAYLLAGIFFGVFYWALERTWPGSLLTIGGDGAGTAFTISGGIYYSFVTLATLGYGDILPRSDAARGLAILEAVAGQLFLCVMVAYLVSRHVSGPSEPRPPGRGGAPPEST